VLGGGARDAIASVAYDLDGRRLAVGGQKGTVRLVDASTGKMVCETLPLGVEILRVAFSGPGLGLVAASSFDHALRTWPVDNCQSDPIRHVGHRDLVMDIGFTGDDAYLVSVSHDSTIKLWDPKTEDEPFSRRMARSVAGSGVAYNFSRLATAPGGPSSLKGPGARTRIATVGHEESDAIGEPVTLWDLASRATADELKKLPGGAQPVDLTMIPGRLKLAREIRVEPMQLKDQLPGCR
jgi:hypothetical protein